MASQSRSECSLSSPTIHRRHAWRRIVGAVSGVTATTSTAMMWTATLQIVVMRITEATARKRGTGVTAAMKGVATDTDSTTTTTPSSSAATAGVVATTATATAMMTTATEGQAMVVKHGEAVTPPSRRVSTARGRETARQGAVTGAKALAMVDDAVPMRRAQSVANLQFMFALRTLNAQDAAKNITDMHKHQPPSGKHALVAPTADFNGFLAKAHNLDAALQIDWPALQVRAPASNIDDLEQALARMEIAAAAATPESCRGMSPPPSPLRSRQLAHGPVTNHGLGQADGIEAGHGPPLIGPAKVVGEQAGQLPVGPPGVGSPGLTGQPSPTGLASRGEVDEAIFKTLAHEATEKVAAAPSPGTHNRTQPALTQATGGSSPTADHTSPHSDRLGNLFKAVTPPFLDRPSSTPPAKSRPVLTKRCRIARLAEYSSTNPRRSSRIAGKPKMTPMQKCHRVLMKRLGLLRTHASLDEVLAEYVTMFNGPLPPHIITALTSIFDLDYDDDGNGDQPPEEALLKVVGEGIAELADEVDEVAA
ncbi:hypothetical protein OsJ_13708 [Oryza sativa Japonica Group]|uniref:Uncharacterized protein n=1 Tax=Oryza sativa subsp. japonica TaxID=39947 RepID=B9FDJ1_ORYSJ|nr:hypothetical protein OsJ_13708 [Oryza sativa Japonica Group]